MNLKLQFMRWKPDADVSGESAGMAYGDRVLDLVTTHGDDGKTYPWEVVDGCEAIAFGTAASASAARRAAETAARREFIRAA